MVDSLTFTSGLCVERRNDLRACTLTKVEIDEEG